MGSHFWIISIGSYNMGSHFWCITVVSFNIGHSFYSHCCGISIYYGQSFPNHSCCIISNLTAIFFNHLNYPKIQLAFFSPFQHSVTAIMVKSLKLLLCTESNRGYSQPKLERPLLSVLFLIKCQLCPSSYMKEQAVKKQKYLLLIKWNKAEIMIIIKWKKAKSMLKKAKMMLLVKSGKLFFNE